MDKQPLAAPAELIDIQQQLDAWRSSPERGRRIPEHLWKAAAGVAREFGLYRTARFLRLDYYGLVKRVDALQGLSGPGSSGGGGKLPATGQTAFVELPAPATLVCQCLIELADGRGASMRMHLQGAEYPNIVALGRSFWSAD